MGSGSLWLSQLATEYVCVPVRAVVGGALYNPTGDVVQFAFMPQVTQVPRDIDWVSGSWETITASLLYPYSARCLVGPAGAVALGVGRYVIYVKVSDSPEIPVLIAGYLEVS